MDAKYVKPWSAGLDSEPAAVARRLGRLLSALGDEINENVIQRGELTDDLRDLRIKIHDRIAAEGWRIKAKQSSGYRVLPPKDGAR